MMKQLYIDALAKTEEAKWYPEYKEFTARVAGVKDWNNPADATTDLLKEMVYAGVNGVSKIVDALSFFPINKRPDVEVFRPIIAEIAAARNARLPEDVIKICREKFYKLAGRNTHSIFNRVVAAFMPDIVSPVVTPADFNDAYEKLCEDKFIPRTRVAPGGDDWFVLNAWVMKKLRELVPDGEFNDVGHGADNYRRGIAVWGVHMLDMEVWKILHRK